MTQDREGLVITGATGHSGGWFMKRLAEDPASAGLRLRCLVRPTSEVASLQALPLQIEWFEGDLSDDASLDRMLEGMTTVIHFAGIQHSRRLVAAAKRQSVGWLILVHTTGRYSKYKSASAEYIDIEEWVIHESGVNYTILRPTMIYGSRRDRNLWKLIDFLYRHPVFPVFGAGRNLMQPIHARDVADAVYLAFMQKGATTNRAYNIAGKEPLAYIELLQIVSRKLGKKTLFVHVPYAISYWAAKLYNLVSRRAVISVEQVMRMNEDKAFDYGEATREFGFAPVSFEQGIDEEIEEYLTEVVRR